MWRPACCAERWPETARPGRPPTRCDHWSHRRYRRSRPSGRATRGEPMDTELSSGATRASGPTVSGGVHTLTVSGAVPGTHLRVLDDDGSDVVTLVVDEAGNAHLAFVPDTPALLDSPSAVVEVLATGDTLPAGTYRIVEDTGTEPTEVGRARVTSVDELPDPSLYDQELSEGYGYLTVRDGVQLSVMVRFPDADALRSGALPDGHRVLRLLPLGPRRSTTLDAAGEPDGLRRRRREHAWQRLFGRRVRRVQPCPGGRRLRRGRDRGAPAVGAARPARDGGAQLPRDQPAVRRGDPATRTWRPSRRCR